MMLLLGTQGDPKSKELEGAFNHWHVRHFVLGNSLLWSCPMQTKRCLALPLASAHEIPIAFLQVVAIKIPPLSKYPFESNILPRTTDLEENSLDLRKGHS